MKLTQLQFGLKWDFNSCFTFGLQSLSHNGSPAHITLTPVGSSSLKVIAALVGKFAVAGSFGVIYLFSAELFPTQVRYWYWN